MEGNVFKTSQALRNLRIAVFLCNIFNKQISMMHTFKNVHMVGLHNRVIAIIVCPMAYFGK